jgi:hypothetical protein
MNRNSKALRKNGLTSFNNGASWSVKAVEIVKGRCVNSSKEREKAGKKPWQGAMRQPPKNIKAAIESAE